MTDQEKYIEGQKASGIEVGDEVRATSHFTAHEGGSRATKSRTGGYKQKFVDDKAIGVVKKDNGSHFWVDCGPEYLGGWSFPCFVLEIIKKADGNVPDKPDANAKEPCRDCIHLDSIVCSQCPTFDGSCTCHTGNPPCGYCEGSLWEEETIEQKNVMNTILERMTNMSVQEQTVFDVTIVERTEVLHEASGVVQAINRAVLFDGKVAAVGNIAAQQKAIATCGTKNFDKLEITCEPF